MLSSAMLLASIAPNVQAQTTQLPEPTEVSASGSDNTVVVEWVSVLSDVTSYVLTLTHDTEETRQEIVMISSDRAGNHIFDNLTHASNYELSVVAQGDPSQHSASPPYTIIVMTEQPQLSAPTGVTARADVRIRMTVNWDGGVENATGYDVTLYATYVDPLITETVEVGKVSLDMSASTHIFEELHSQTNYRVSVVATAEGYRDSEETNAFEMTDTQIEPIDRSKITLSASAGSITVHSVANCAPPRPPEGQTTDVLSGLYTFVSSIGSFTFDSTVDGRRIVENLTPDTIYTFEVSSVCLGRTIGADGRLVSIIRTPGRMLGNPFRISIRTLSFGEKATFTDVNEDQNITSVATEDSITLSWPSEAAPAGATQYVFEISGGSSDAMEQVATITNGRHEFASLDPNTPYTISVIARGNTELYEDSRAVPLINERTLKLQLDAPAIEANIVNEVDIRVTWMGPDEAVTYTVNLYESANESTPVDTGEVSSPRMTYTFSDNAPRTTYIVSIVASADGYLNSTEERLDDIITEKVTLATVGSRQGITSTSDVTENNNIRLSWLATSAPTNAIQYVFRIIGGTSDFNETFTVAISAGSYEFTDLRADTAYTITVIARGDTDLYNDSETAFGIQATTLQEKLATPIVSATVDGSSIVATWQEIDNANQYTVNLYRIANGMRISVNDEASLNRTHTFLNIMPGETYEIGVVANPVGGSEFRSSNEGRSIALEKITLPRVSVVSSEFSIVVLWQRISEATIFRVNLYASTDGENPVATEEVVGSGYTFINSTPGTTYIAGVVASADGYHASDEGRSSGIMIDKTTLADVTDDQNMTSAETEDSITLSWPAEDAPEIATHYVFEITGGASADSGLVPVDIEDETYEFTGLDPDTLYMITVIARADTAFYNDSESDFNIDVTTSMLEQLDAPATVTAAANGFNINVSWEGISEATAYTVNLYASTDRENPVATEEVPGLTYIFENSMPSDIAYIVSVAASADGYRNSPETRSDEITIVKATLEDVTAGQITTVVAAYNRITLSWSAENAPVKAKYVLEISGGPSDANGPVSVDIEDGTYEFTGLSFETTYTITVAARGDTDFYNNGDAVVNIQAITPMEPPQLSAPTGVTARSDTRIRMTVNWDEVESATGYDVTLYATYVDPLITETVEVGKVSLDMSASTHRFERIHSQTAYRVSVVATAEGYRDSEETNVLEMTGTQIVAIDRSKITLSASARSITVHSAANCVAPAVSGGNSSEAAGLYTFVSSIASFTLDSTVDGARRIVENLTPNTIYTFEVSSSCSVRTLSPTGRLTSFSSSPDKLNGLSNPFRTSIRTADFPQLSSPSVTVAVQNEKDIFVTWTASEAATTYTVNLYETTNGNDLIATEEVFLPTRAYTFSNSTLSKTYIVGVVASAKNYSNSMEARSVEIATGQETLADVNTSQAIRRSVGPINIRLSWLSVDAPDNATHYVFRITGGPSDTNEATVPISEMDYNFTGLSAETLYTISVIARADLYNDSEAVFNIGATTSIKEKLNAPTTVTAAVSGFDIDVSWTNISEATTYTVNLYESANASSPVAIEEVSSPETTHTFRNRTRKTTYIVGVVASAEAYFDSNEGRSSEITVNKVTLADVNALQGISPSVGSGNIRLSWLSGNAPDNATHYVFRITGGSSDVNEAIVPTSESNYNFIGLSANTLYTISVIARADVANYNDSQISFEIQATTLQVKLATPIVSAIANGLNIVATWEEVDNSNRYTVILYEIINGAGSIKGTAVSLNETHTFSNLMPGKTYAVGVIARSNGFRTSDQGRSDNVIILTQLATVDDGQNIAFSVTTNSIRLSWDGPAPDNATQYVFEISGGPSDDMGREVPVNIVDGTYQFSGLSANTLYTIAVIARDDTASYNDSSPFNIDVTTSMQEQLNAPATVSALANGFNIDVTWDAVENAEGYTVNLYAGTDRETPVVTEEVSSAAFSYTFENSTPLDTTYIVGVVASADGFSASSEGMSDEITIEKATLADVTSNQNIMASTATADSITLSWNVNDAPDFATQYVFKRGETEEAIAVGDGTYQFTDLRANTPYTIMVTARGNTAFYNDSDTAFEIQANTLQEKLSAGRIFAFAREFNIIVSWLNFGPTTTYTVNLYESTDEANPVDTVEVYTPRSNHTLRDSTPGKTYIVGVAASAVGYRDSDEVRSGDITIGRATLATVDAGQNITSAETANSITLSWVVGDAPDNATQYVFEISGGPSDDAGPVPVNIGDGTYQFSGLSANTLYTIAVIARGDTASYNDSGPLNIEVTTSMQEQQLDTPTVSATVDVFNIVVTWDAVESAEGYTVNLYAGTDGENSIATEEITDGLTYTFENSTPGTTYIVGVAASAVGYRDSDEVRSGDITIGRATLATVDAGQNITSAETANSITLSWVVGDAPDNATQYVFEISGGPSDDAGPVPVNIGDGTYQFSGLSANTLYTIAVIARGDTASYNDSGPLNIEVTTSMQEQQLDTPTVTAAVDVFNIVVTWDAVESAEGYTVNLYAGTDRETPIATEEITDGLTYTFEKRMPGTTYIVGVVASAESFSASSEGMSDEITIEKATLATVDAGQITTSSVTADGITLSWTAGNAQENATQYVFEISGGASVMTQVSEITDGSYEFSNLSPDTLYTITVIARGDTASYNDSSPLNIEVRTKPKLAPGKVAGVTASVVNETEISVTWSLLQGAENYTVKVYLADNIEMAIMTTVLNNVARMHTFKGLEPDRIFTVGVTATADNFIGPSEESTVTATITLQTPRVTVEVRGFDIVATWQDVPNAVSYGLILYNTMGREVRIASVRAPIVSTTFVRTVPGTYTVGVAAHPLSHSLAYVSSTEERSTEITIEKATFDDVTDGQNITSAVTADSITLSWPPEDAPDNTTISLDFYVFTRDETEPVAIEIRHGTYTITDLRANTTYTISVIARDISVFYNDSATPFNIEVTTSRQEQEQLTLPVVTAAVDVFNIVVTWDAVESAEGYTVNLYAGTDRETPIATEEVTDMLTYTFENSTPSDTAYTVGVIAVPNPLLNEISEEGVSDEITVEKVTLADVTDSQNITSAVTAESITLSWPADLAPDNASHYVFEISGGASDSVDPAPVVDGTYTFTGLNANTTYTIMVTARADTAFYNDSAAFNIDAMTSETPRLKLDTPQITSVTLVNQRGIHVIWEAVDGADRYGVSITPIDGFDAVASRSVLASSTLSVTFSPLRTESSTTYTVAVLALRSLPGGFLRSEATTEITTGDAPEIPRLPTLRESDVSLSIGSVSVQVTIDLSEVPTEIRVRTTSYVISLIDFNGNNVGFLTFSDLTDSITATFDELTPSRAYTLRISSFTNDRSLYLDSEIRVQMFVTNDDEAMLESPSNVSVRVENEVEIVVTWDAVNSAEEYEINIYDAENTLQGDRTVTIDSNDEREHTFSSLSPVSTYTVGVVAIAENYLNSEEARSDDLITTTQMLLVPANITITEMTNSIIVSWLSAPSNVISYAISLDSGNQQLFDATATGSTEFRRLQPDTDYTVEVIAHGDARSYTASNAYTETVKTLRIPQLDPILGVEVSIENEVEIVVTWDTVNNAEEYEIKIYDAENTLQGDRTETIDSNDEREHTFSSLSPVSTYTVGVVAIAENYLNSEEARSEEIATQKLTLADVTADQNIARAVTENSVTLSWDVNNAPDGATQYVFEITGGLSAVSGQQVSIDITDGTYRFTDLEQTTLYTIKVIARGNTDLYNDSEGVFNIRVATRALELLGTPAVTGASVSGFDIVVRWTNISEAGTYTVSLYASSDRENAIATEEVPAPVLTYTFAKSTPSDTTYIVGVVASAEGFNAGGEGRFAGITVVKATLADVTDGQNITSAETVDSITLSWSAGDAPDNATHYVFRLDETEEAIAVGDGTYQFTDLRANTPYTIMVTARGNTAFYNDSDTAFNIEATTEKEQLATPMVTESVSGFDIVVIWTDISEAGTYTVSLYASLDRENAIATEEVSSAVLTYTFGKSTPSDTTYIVGVVASSEGLSASGEGVSDEITVVKATLADVTDGQNITSAETADSITLSWDANDAPDFATHYVFKRGQGEEVPVDIEVGTYTFTGLNANTTYTIMVTARADTTFYNDSDNDFDIEATTEKERLATPVPSVRVDGFDIVVTWEEVPNTVTYLVSLDNDLRGEVSASAPSAPASTHTFLNNTPGTYTVRVSAAPNFALYDISRIGVSAEITVEKVTLADVADGQNITSAETADSITLSWDANDAPDFATHYVFKRGQGEEVPVDIEVGTYTFTGLNANTTYTIMVTARADTDFYNDSDAVFNIEATTEKEQLATPIVTAAVDVFNIAVSWDAISEATAYTVNLYRSDRENSIATEEVTDGLTYTFESSTPSDTTYIVGVVASAEGFSASPEARAIAVTVEKVTLADVADGQNITSAETADSITLSWDANDAPDFATHYVFKRGQGEEVPVDIEVGTYVLPGLSANTPYTITVTARADTDFYNDSDAVFNINVTTPLPQLATAEGVMASIENEVNIVVVWNAVEGAEEYVVNLYLSDDLDNVNMKTELNDAARMHTFEGLNPATSYRVGVVATAANYRASEESTAPATTLRQTLPTPTEIEITATETTISITVNWRNVPAIVTSYELTLEGGSTREERVVNTGAAGSRIFRGLAAGTEYTLTAVSSGDNSAYLRSTTYSTNITTNIDQLGTPTIISTNVESDVNIAVEWTEVANATAYRLRVYRSDDSSMADITGQSPRVIAEALMHTFEGLALATTYTVSVEAIAANYLDSMASTEEVVTEETATLEQLPAPKDADFMIVPTTNSVVVNWDSGEADSRATDYVFGIKVFEGGIIEEGRLVDIAGNTTVFNEGILVTTTYEISVIARGNQAVVRNSSVYTTRTTTQQLEQLESLSNVSAMVENEVEIVVTWDAVNSAEEYEINIYDAENTLQGDRTERIDSNDEREHTFSSLSPVSTYTVGVVAIAENYLNSEEARSDEIVTQKLTLADVTTSQNIAFTVTAMSITLSWEGSLAPTNAMQYVFGREDSAAETVAEIDDGTVVLSELDANTPYTIRVTARGDIDLYNDSATVFNIDVTTEKEQLATPTVTASVSGFDIVVIWTDISEAGTYTVSLYASSDRENAIATEEVSSAAFTYTFAKSTPGATYIVGVVASADGFNASDKGSSGETMTEKATLANVGEAQNITTSTVTADSITLSWDANDAPDFATHYVFKRGQGEEVPVDIEVGTYTFTGLNANTTYTIMVTARADTDFYNDSDAVFNIEATTEKERLATPTISVEVRGFDIVVTWEEVPNANLYIVSLLNNLGETVSSAGPTTLGHTFENVTPGTGYTVTVGALGGFLVYEPSAEARSNEITIDKATLADVGVGQNIANAVTADSITLSWDANDAPDFATHYVFKRGQGEEVPVDIEVGTYTFTGLNANTTYTIMVTARADTDFYNDSDAVFNIEATTEKEQLATPTVTESVSGFDIVVIWTDISEAGTYTVSLYASSDRENAIATEEVPAPVLTYTFAKSTPGATYIVGVVASSEGFSASGEGVSDEITVVKATLADVTDGQNITSAETADSITLSWDANDAPDFAIQYVFKRGQGEEVPVDIEVGTYVLPSLSANTPYTITVTARADTDFYNDSDAVFNIEATTEKEQLATPTVTESVSGFDIVVIWTDISEAGTYTVSLYESSDRENAIATEEVPAPVLTYTFGKSTPSDTTYIVGVVASSEGFSASGEGVSDEITVVKATLADVTDGQNITSAETADSITLSWDANDAPDFATHYVFKRGQGEEVPVDIEVGTYVLPGLSANTPYTITVTARADTDFYNDSDAVFNINVTTPLPQLATAEGVMASIENEVNIVVVWNAVEGAEEYVVNLYLSDDLDNVNMETELNDAARTHTFEGLNPATSYRVGVVATAANYRASEESTAPATTLRQTLPTPTEIEITATETTISITVNWRNVPAIVTSYELALEGGSTREERVVNTGTAGSRIFRGLAAGTEYTLTAVSSGDNSAYLRSTTYSTNITTNIDQLGTPTIISTNVESDVNIAVEWTDVANATAYRLRVYRSDDSSMADITGQSPRVIAEALMHTFEGLALATAYTVSVEAIAANYLDSMASAEEVVTEETATLEQLPAPKDADFMIVPTTNSVVVNWDSGEADSRATGYVFGIKVFEGGIIEEGRLVDIAGNTTVFNEGILVATTYEISVIARGNQAVVRNSSVYTTRTTTQQLEQLESLSNVSAMVENEVEIVVTWDAVNSAEEYEINIYDAENTLQGDRTERIDSNDEREHTFSSLSPVSTYTVGVVAIAENYLNSEEARSDEIVTQKLTLADVTTSQNIAFTVTAMSITLSWNGSLAPTNAMQYVFGREDSAAETVAEIDDGTVVLSELDANTPYTIRVTARGDIDLYNDSATVFNIDVTTEKEQLATPTVTASVSGFDIVVIWTDISEAGTYTVSLYASSDRENAIATEEVSSAAFTYTFAKSTPGATYIVGVVASADGFNASDKGSSGETMTEKATLANVGEAQNITTSTVTADSITLSWDANDAPDFATHYVFKRGQGEEVPVDIEVGTYVLPGLNANTTYTIMVTARADTDFYNDSDAVFNIEATTEKEQLATPTVTESVSGFDIVVIWTDISEAGTYTVSLYASSDRENAIATEEVSSAALTYTFAKSTPSDTTYIVGVVASAKGFSASDEGVSGEITVVKATLANVGEAQNITTSAVTAESITLSWDGPAPTNATHYVFEISGGASDSVNPAPVADETYTFTGLNANTTYTIMVTARADTDFYNDSDAVFNIEATTSMLEQLEMPMISSATVEDDVNITVKWQETTGATGYLVAVYESANSSNVIRSERVSSADALMQTFRALELATSYTISVIATADGYRASEAATTEVRTTDETDRTRLSAPTSAQITVTATEDSISVSQVNASTGVESYRIRISLDNENIGEERISTNTSSHAFTELRSGTAYEIQVIASGAQDQYIDSNAYSTTITTLMPQLGTATVSAAILDEVNIVVDWDEVEGTEEYVVNLYLSDDLSTVETTAIVSSDAESMYTFAGLNPVTSYTVGVVATAEGYRKSAEARPEEIMTEKATLATVAVGQITTSSVTADSITLSWTADLAPDNATHYVFEISGGASDSVDPAPVAGGTYTFTGLNANTTYTIMVTARADTDFYNDSDTAFNIDVMTAETTVPEQGSGLRLRLRVFLEGPLQ